MGAGPLQLPPERWSRDPGARTHPALSAPRRARPARWSRDSGARAPPATPEIAGVPVAAKLHRHTRYG